MKRTPLGGHMASQDQQQVYQQQQQQQHYQFQHDEQDIRRKLKRSPPQQQAAKHQASSSPTLQSCANVSCSRSNSSTRSSTSSSSTSSSTHSSSISSNKPSSPSSIYSSTSSVSSSSSTVSSILRRKPGAAVPGSNTGIMHRHRKKDRLDRAAAAAAAAAAAPKYMYSGSTTSPPLTPISNENLYQPCFGSGPGREQPEQQPAGAPPIASDGAGATCCQVMVPTRQHRMHILAPSSLTTGCYPEADPDSIEVYRDQQQHQQQQLNPELHASILAPADNRHVPRHLHFSKWSGGNASASGPPVVNSPGSAGAAAAAAHSQSAEYSYAYCEPILLQRPVPVPVPGEGTGTLLETEGASGASQVPVQRAPGAHSPPPPSLSSSGSSYCVPMYAQQRDQQQRRAGTAHHQPPLLPSLKSLTTGQSTGTGTVFHPGLRPPQQPYHHHAVATHHHHHHHHHNYTLPAGTNSSSSSTNNKPMLTSATSTTTGSLRALFTNIFRKSSSSGIRGQGSVTRPPGSTASDPMMATIPAAAGPPLPLMPPFLEPTLVGPASTERHSFTTCYGTKENIYEDIGSQSGFGSQPGAGTPSQTTKPSSSTTTTTTATAPPLDDPLPADVPEESIAPEPTTNVSEATASEPTPTLFNLSAEWRQVQLQHERIIGELNLSVERLIMPSYDEHQLQQHFAGDQAAGMHLGEVLIHAPPPSAPSLIEGPIEGKTAIQSINHHSRRRQPAHVMQLSIGATAASSPLQQDSRHSPTISYGKSYGDVDSGISSSSTSGTSYSSSILYRSITNYPANKQEPSQQQQQSGRKPILFGLRTTGSAGSSGLFTSPSSSTSLSMAAMLSRGPGGASGRATSVSGPGPGVTATATTSPVRSVTNAPDPPPPPDGGDELELGASSRRCSDTCCTVDLCDLQSLHLQPLHHPALYALHAPAMERCNLDSRLLLPAMHHQHHHHHHTTSRHRTLASCCFFPEQQQQQQQRGAAPPSSTRLEPNSTSGGNFWHRFRKLRQTATGLFGNGGEVTNSAVGGVADERLVEATEDNRRYQHQHHQQQRLVSSWAPLRAPRVQQHYQHLHQQQQQQQYHHPHYHHLSLPSQQEQQQQQQLQLLEHDQQFISPNVPTLQPIVSLDDGTVTTSSTVQLNVEQQQQQQQPSQRIQSTAAPEQQPLRSRSPSSSRSSSSPSTITSASATPSSPSSPVSSSSSAAKMVVQQVNPTTQHV